MRENVFYSVDDLLSEIKWQIKTQYKNQENFSKEFGSSRKTLNRLLNHNNDLQSILRMCKLLNIKEIVLVT